MKTRITSMSSLVFVLLFPIFWAASVHAQEDFIQCLFNYSENSNAISQVIFTPNNSSYTSILDFYIQNLRFTAPTTPRPLLIVTPVNETQIQTTLYCAKEHDMKIRLRSGGHDFEGLSYVAEGQYVILDLFNFHSITVDAENATAWVESGAILGELYYQIANKSRTLGFPAGYWNTVGVGGHLSGGGYGPWLRKYGLAADNVIDARFMDVNGNILDRESMGEDLFWAIRGGGGGNFGIVIAWKIQLVSVPETLTIFTVRKTLEQNGTNVVYKWQSVAHALPEDICITLHTTNVNSSEEGGRAMLFQFVGSYLGGVDDLLPLMEESFPELGLVEEDCAEVSWIQAVLSFGGFSVDDSPEVLRNTTPQAKYYFKTKSDYIEEPIPEDVLDGIWNRTCNIEPGMTELVWSPYGGKMSEISDSATPYPHRAGNLYMMYNPVYWDGETLGPVSPYHINWIRELYDYLTPYVSQNPRSAYVNYRDLDLGVNNVTGNTSYEQASIWGIKYYKNNFPRLVEVKTSIDPGNFLSDPQSIPISTPALRASF